MLNRLDVHLGTLGHIRKRTRLFRPPAVSGCPVDHGFPPEREPDQQPLIDIGSSSLSHIVENTLGI